MLQYHDCQGIARVSVSGKPVTNRAAHRAQRSKRALMNRLLRCAPCAALTEILTGPGPGAASLVRQFRGTPVDLVDSFFAFDPTFLGGIFVGG